MSKICTKCNEVKPVSEFWKTNQLKSGLQSRCKECERIRKRKWWLKNKEKNVAKNKLWIKENPELNKAVKRRWDIKNKNKIKDYYQRNSEWIKARIKQNYYDNREIKKELSRKYALNNPEKCRKWARDFMRRKRQDPKSRLILNMRNAIHRSLKTKKEVPFFELVDYTIEKLIRHIEKQFDKGMTWNNYGRKNGNWSIDHKIPISVFNFKTEKDIDFKRCWALKNLQPMWHNENIKKSNRIDTHFQPFFAF